MESALTGPGDALSPHWPWGCPFIPTGIQTGTWRVPSYGALVRFPNGEHSEMFATVAVLTASLGLQTLHQVPAEKKSNDN